MLKVNTTTDKNFKDWLRQLILNAQKNRLEKLAGIKAPEVMLVQMRESIQFIEEGGMGYSIKKGDEVVLDWNVISSELKVGNGGKQYYVINCEEGIVNYFPNARFGRYVAIQQK